MTFQCRGLLLICSILGKGPTALAVGAGGDCLDIFFSRLSFLFLSPSLWEMARYRLKYCLKGPLRPKHLKRGWSGGAMVLGDLPVPGPPTYLQYIRARAYCACSRCWRGLFGHFFSLVYHFSSFLPLSGRWPDID